MSKDVWEGELKAEIAPSLALFYLPVSSRQRGPPHLYREDLETILEGWTGSSGGLFFSLLLSVMRLACG